MPRCLIGLAAFLGLFVSAAAAAEPFAIDLVVHSGKASKTAHAESAAPDAKTAPRGVLEIKAGDRVTVHWKISAADPKANLEDVTVHFYAIKEEKPGQPPAPKLDKGVVAETALTLDFVSEAKNESELTFTIARPGSYLFRLETLGAAAGLEGHEDFAAIDVTAR